MPSFLNNTGLELSICSSPWYSQWMHNNPASNLISSQTQFNTV